MESETVGIPLDPFGQQYGLVEFCWDIIHRQGAFRRSRKEQSGTKANVAQVLLQAWLLLINKLLAKCSVYQYQKVIRITACVPNSKPEASCSSSKQTRNEPDKPKLLPVGTEEVLEANCCSPP